MLPQFSMYAAAFLGSRSFASTHSHRQPSPARAIPPPAKNSINLYLLNGSAAVSEVLATRMFVPASFADVTLLPHIKRVQGTISIILRVIKRRQNRAALQRLPHPARHPCRRLRLPARQIVPPSNGSSTSTRSPPINAPASSTTPTAKTTPAQKPIPGATRCTFSVSSVRSSPSRSKPTR